MRTTGFAALRVSVLIVVLGAACAETSDPAPVTPRHTIAGTVGGGTAAGVTVTLSGAASRTAVTGTDGSYAFSELAPGAYTVTPSKVGFTFTPASRAVTIVAESAIGRDFTAVAAGPLHAVSGTVSGATAAGVTVALSGAATGTAFTDPGGAYSFSGLADGAYTVTPTKGGYAFAPASLTMTVSGADVAGQNFTASAFAGPFRLSGKITGPVVDGVTVTLSGAESGSATTDPSGAFTFVVAGGAYTVTPSKDGAAFAPSSRDVAVSAADAPGNDFFVFDLEWADWPVPAAAPAGTDYAVDAGRGVVTDAVTGLVWQRAAALDVHAWADAKTYCRTLSLGGWTTGWRLPTNVELGSIVSYGTSYPAIDAAAFPSTPADAFWTATPDAALTGYGRAVLFTTGEHTVGALSNLGRVRCVRSPLRAAPAPGTVPAHYTVSADTVRDELTGLTWQRQASYLTLADAQSGCAALSLGGFATGWRLPTIKELQSLVDIRRAGPAADPVAFPGTPADMHWSTTASHSRGGYTWAIDFTSGDMYVGLPSFTAWARCVR